MGGGYAPSCTHTTLAQLPPSARAALYAPLPATHRNVSTLQLSGCNDPAPQCRHCIPSHPQSGGNGAGAGGRTPASDSIWWTRLIVDAVTGDKAAVTELAAAAEELTRRLNKNGHFARNAVQLAELSTHCMCEQLRAALTVTPP